MNILHALEGLRVLFGEQPKVFLDHLFELPEGSLDEHKCVLCRRLCAFVGYVGDGHNYCFTHGSSKPGSTRVRLLSHGDLLFIRSIVDRCSITYQFQNDYPKVTFVDSSKFPYSNGKFSLDLVELRHEIGKISDLKHMEQFLLWDYPKVVPLPSTESKLLRIVGELWPRRPATTLEDAVAIMVNMGDNFPQSVATRAKFGSDFHVDRLPVRALAFASSSSLLSS